jgi:Zn-dependent protease
MVARLLYDEQYVGRRTRQQGFQWISQRRLGLLTGWRRILEVMNESVRIGRVAGIRVGANWSLLVIFSLIVLGLGAAEFPYDAPGHTTVAYYLAAAGVAVLFFTCLLAHELAHAIVARRRHIEVDGIVLWLLGGVSKFKTEAADATDELRVALAGPAMSLLLALCFFLLSRWAGLAGPTSLLAAAFGWLGWINALLALFNLLPAFPLDGGRVLRSALWSRSGDKQRATRTAAKVGEVFGYGFMVLGLLGLFVGGYFFDGLWLAAIGWFLATGAKAEAQASEQSSELAGLTVRDAMSARPFTVPAWVSLDSLMKEGVHLRRLSTFPVVDPGGWFVGLVTLDDIRKVPPERWAATSCGWVTRPAARCVTCDPEENLASVGIRMSAYREHLAVVLSRGYVVGVLSEGDMQRAAAHHVLWSDERHLQHV